MDINLVSKFLWNIWGFSDGIVYDFCLDEIQQLFLYANSFDDFHGVLLPDHI